MVYIYGRFLFQVEESVPYDPKGGVVPNEGGRVVDHPWLYCAGWLATGPRGVIVDTMTAAYSVAQVHQPRLAFSHQKFSSINLINRI